MNHLTLPSSNIVANEGHRPNHTRFDEEALLQFKNSKFKISQNRNSATLAFAKTILLLLHTQWSSSCFASSRIALRLGVHVYLISHSRSGMSFERETSEHTIRGREKAECLHWARKDLLFGPPNPPSLNTIGFVLGSSCSFSGAVSSSGRNTCRFFSWSLPRMVLSNRGQPGGWLAGRDTVCV